MVGYDTMRRWLAAIIAVYLILLAGGVNWHWSSEPLYARPTPGLLLAFGVTAALVGLISIWAALAVSHWSGRASGLITGIAVVAGVPTMFFEWNHSLVWQLLVIVYVQLAALVIVLATMRLFGCTIRSSAEPSNDSANGEGTRAGQFTIRNLFLITSALGLLFSVIHFTRPIELGGTLYEILVWGGMCAALVSLIAFWASFSSQHIAIRVVALFAAAPVGGICYRAMTNYAPLLMSSEFYAGVTTVQILCMTLPLTVVRLSGFRFCRGDSRVRRLVG
jgi:hypothetical protein